MSIYSGDEDCGDEITSPECCEPEPEVWRCEGCGKTFDIGQLSHSRASHAPGCDGYCRNCPVEVECGPISKVRP